MHQPVLYLDEPSSPNEPTPLVAERTQFAPVKVDVDGIIDPKSAVEYIGKAKRQPDGTYHALAKVPTSQGMCLAFVECKITFTEKNG